MTTAPIRILLADDHAVVREGLRGLLEQEPGMLVIDGVADGAAAVRVAASERPDVVILDLKMPGAAPVDTIAGLRAAAPDVQILVFTSYAEDAQVRDALTAGASGYLLKDALREDLIRAVREVHAGRAWLDPQAQRQMLEWMRRPPSILASLTEREQSVLALIAEGCSNKHIARKLALTEGTVKGYVSQVLGKLGVTDRTQAALLAQREGLPQPKR